MLCRTTIISAPSGSIGGIVASRNRAGTYFRSRTVPVNPNSSYQQAVRSAMAQLSARWTETLTQAQRDDWNAYAEAVPLPNRLGDMVNVGGLGMYIRTNVLVLQTGGAGGSILDDAPDVFTLGQFTAPSISNISEATQLVSIAFTAADDWANEDDANMLVYISPPKTQGRNFYRGPYRYAGKIDGDSVTPPTSPATVSLQWPAVEDQKLFARIRVIRADGRVSAEWFGSAIATA